MMGAIVIPAKAGIGQVAMPPAWLRPAGQAAPAPSGRDVSACLHETPAFGVPAKYYFAGCPCAGVTGKRHA